MPQLVREPSSQSSPLQELWQEWVRLFSVVRSALDGSIKFLRTWHFSDITALPGWCVRTLPVLLTRSWRVLEHIVDIRHAQGRQHIAVLTVIAPSLAILFFLTLGRAAFPDWQGERNALLKVYLLNWWTFVVYAPLFLWSMGSVVALVSHISAVQWPLVRAGVKMGVVLALWYAIWGSVVLEYLVFVPVSLGVLLCVCGVLIGMNWLRERRIFNGVMALLFLGGLVLEGGMTVVSLVSSALGLGNVGFYPLSLAFIPLMFFPLFIPSTAAFFGWMLVRQFPQLLQEGRPHLPRGAPRAQSQESLTETHVVQAGTVVFLGATGVAISQAMVRFAQLPKVSSSCYVVTASAQGHEWVVGKGFWTQTMDQGETIRVTAQLQHLKAGELALQTVAPQLHAVIRCMYDRVGPCVARQVRRSTWLADLAYLSCTPIEWSVTLLLRMLVPQYDQVVKQLYRASEISQPRA